MEPAVLHIDSEKGWRGGQQQAWYLYAALLEKGIKTGFICKSGTEFCKRLKKASLPHYPLPLKNELDIFSAFKIAGYAKKNNFNILHCHSSHALSAGLLAAKFNSELKVIGVRRVDFNINGNFLSRKKYTSKNLKKIVCISEAIKNVLIKNGISEDKINVIHSGIDLDRMKNGNGDKIKAEFGLNDEFIAGSVISLVGHKDPQNLVKAASIVCRKHENIKFLIAGDGYLKNETEKMINDLGIAGKVILLGYREDVPDLMNAFDIFLMPSKMEGLGTSVLDAMSLGIPVVSTNAGGITEAVKDDVNGIVVEKQDPEAFAKAIDTMISRKDLRKKYSENALKVVKKFDINRTVSKNIELYGSILSEGDSR